MTAHFVLLAQTKVGFLSGGRGRHMKELSENEVLAQLEEAYARATVALTRAQKLCIIMGPLDMRGLPGAATVIGCLKYGAGVCGVHDSNQAAEVFLKDGSLNDGPDDDAFLQSLRRSLKTARGAYPPVALAEIYQEFKSPLTMIRRLHLMVVDLDRSRSVSSQVYRDFMNCRGSLDPAGSLNTLPVPLSGQEVPYQTRYVFAYGMDNSDRPCYLLWPIRGGNGQFLLVDPWSGNYFDLETAKFVKPIGIEHFFDAFSLEKKRPLKIDAASALNIQVKDVSDSLVVNEDKATRFELTPVWAPAEPPAKRAKTAEVRLSSASNVPRPPIRVMRMRKVVRKKRTVTALAQTPTSVAKTIPQMCLTWRNLTKRTLTSVLSPKMWTHERWNGMAQLTKTKRWVGGWGPRYLASKRERGPVRVPSSLTEDEFWRPLMSSFWNHERTWLRLTPLPAGWCCPWGLGRVNQCCVVDRPQRHPPPGDSG